VKIRQDGRRTQRKVALFFCRRSVKEPVRTRAPRFTVKEIEPFVAVEYRDGALIGSVVVAAIGVAIRKEDGKWGVHELSDETDFCRARRNGASPEPVEGLRDRAALEMKRRLVNALNRLKEHYERVYVYSMKP
jgi:hypothetical protein